MLKKTILTLFTYSIFLNAKSQTLNLKIHSTGLTPNRYHLIYNDTSLFQIDVGNLSSSNQLALWYYRISRTDEADPLVGNNLLTDSVIIAPNDTTRYFLRDFANAANALIDESFYNFYQEKGSIPFGNYKLYISLRDTSGFIIAADSVNFTTDTINPAYNIYPLNGIPIHISHINRINFGYTFKHFSQFPGMKFKFKMWVCDSLNHDFSILQSSPIYTAISYHSYHFKIPTGGYTFLPNKFYYWQIETESAGGVCIGYNNGRSDPYYFQTTQVLLDSTNGFYRDTIDVWSKEDLPGIISPPDPQYCQIFTGFETGSIEQNGWQPFQGEITPSNRRKGNLYSPEDKGLVYGIWSGYHNDLLNQAPPIDGRFGQKCAYIGDLSSPMNRSSSSLRKTFTVTTNTKKIRIWYSVVAEGPDAHSATNEEFWKKNFFQITAYQGSTVDKNNVIEDPIIHHSGIRDFDNTCFDFIGSPQRLRVRWICKEMDLGKYIGVTITLDLVVASCMPLLGSGGNHKTMAFVDFCVTEGTLSVITENQTNYCKNSNISFTGAQSLYHTSYQWEVWQSNVQGNLLNRIGFVQGVCAGSQMQTCNVSQLLAARGLQQNCGDYYKVLLITRHGCCNWDTATRLITITCPVKVNSGPHCCNNWNCSILLGNSNVAGYTYNWKGIGGTAGCLSATNIAQPTFSCGSFNPGCNITGNLPLTYWVHVTDNNGCKDSQAVVISTLPISASISLDTGQCHLKLCGNILSTPNQAYTFSWQRISPSPTFPLGTRCIEILPSTAETWTLSVSNDCGTTSSNITLPATTLLTGPIDTLVFPQSMCGVSTFDFPIRYQNASNPNSRYNIFEYKLFLLKYAGPNLVPTEVGSGYNTKGFANGDIKINNAILKNVVETGKENLLTIQMRNCDPTNDKLYYSLNPYNAFYTRPNMCEDPVCIGPSNRKLIRSYYIDHADGSNSQCFQLTSGQSYCNGSNWSDVCSKADKNSKVTRVHFTKVCLCSHKVWAYPYQSQCNPAYYYQAGQVLIYRNNGVANKYSNGSNFIHFER